MVLDAIRRDAKEVQMIFTYTDFPFGLLNGKERAIKLYPYSVPKTASDYHEDFLIFCLGNHDDKCDCRGCKELEDNDGTLG